MESIISTTKAKASRNFWKYGAISIGLIWLAAIILSPVAYYAGSPFLTIWQMSNAVRNHDGKTFVSFIDFPTFKDNLKAELTTQIMDGDTNKNPFAGLGAMLAPAIVENYITPATIEKMINKADPESVKTSPEFRGIPAAVDVNPITNDNVQLAYTSLDEFEVRIRTKDNKVAVLIFARHWIGDWKLSDIRLPKTANAA